MKYVLRGTNRSLAIDGVKRPAAAPSRPVTAPPSPVKPAATISKKSSAAPSSAVSSQKRKRRRVPAWAQTLLAFPLLLAGGIAIQSPAVGQFLIAAYGVVAFLCRIPSRTTFSLVFVAMAGTIAVLMIHGNIPLVHHFTTYTFLLLVVGVITLSRELKKEGGRIYSRYNRH